MANKKKKSTAQKQKKSGFVGYLILAAVLVIAGLLIYGSISRSMALRAFNPYIQQYAAMGATEVSDYTPSAPMKIFVIGEEKDDNDAVVYKTDALYQKLPKALKAKTPGEVNTVLKIKRYYELVSTNSLGGKAFQVMIDAKLIDVQSQAVYKQSTFSGPEPTVRKSSSGDVAGASPDKDVIIWVKAMAGIGQ